MTNQNSELQELRQAVLTELETPSKKFRGRGLFSITKGAAHLPANTRMVGSVGRGWCAEA